MTKYDNIEEDMKNVMDSIVTKIILFDSTKIYIDIIE